MKAPRKCNLDGYASITDMAAVMTKTMLQYTGKINMINNNSVTHFKILILLHFSSIASAQIPLRKFGHVQCRNEREDIEV